MFFRMGVFGKYEDLNELIFVKQTEARERNIKPLKNNPSKYHFSVNHSFSHTEKPEV